MIPEALAPIPAIHIGFPIPFFSSSIAILFESCPTFEAPTHGKIAMFAPQQPHFAYSAIIDSLLL
jgi:hypothetical protein